MKYCLFDGGDVVGPFTAQQLLHRAGFGSHSLVCPEEHSEEESFWKEAHFYEEFGFAPQEAPRETAAASASEQFLKEMDSVMTELSSFSVGEKVSASDKEDAAVLPAEQESQAEEKNPRTPASSVLQPPAVSPVKPLEEKEQPLSSAVKAQSSPKQEKTEEKSSLNAEEKSKEKSLSQTPKISSVLMQASEDMKRRRVGREAVSRAEEQQRAALAAQADLSEGKPSEPKASLPSVPQDKEEQNVVSKSQVQTRTVNQNSPIEEYFNTIKSGDLGNILGIPDAKENSDMNLVRALENQFEKTEPGTVGKPLEEDPFDEFTPKEKPAKEPAPVLTDISAQADRETEANLTRSLPDLKSAEALPLSGEKQTTKEDAEADTIPPATQEMIVPEQEDDPDDKTVKTILEGKLKVDTLRQEIPEPIKDVPAEDKIQPPPASASEESEERVVKKRPAGKMKFAFMAVGFVLLLAGAWLNWKHEEPSPEGDSAAQVSGPKAPQANAEASPAVPAAREVIHALQPSADKDPLKLAKEIVQNYQLDKGRGTVEEYLNHRYGKQLSEGYAAVWSAERLHRNSYVVKYRLAKTRKEPIVYIFQADTDKKKLTGALNNITLDLVGKIS